LQHAMQYVHEHYYSQPYKNKSSGMDFDLRVEVDGQQRKIHRPNHCTPHALRKAVLAPYVAKERNGKEDFTFTPDEMLQVQLHLLFSVTGRQNDSSHKDNDQGYEAWRHASEQNLETYIREYRSKIPIDAKHPAKLNEQQKKLKQFCHSLDGIRCRDKLSHKYTGLGSSSKLISYAAELCEATGDRIMADNCGKSTKDYDPGVFFRCSQDPMSCLKAISSVAPPFELDAEAPTSTRNLKSSQYGKLYDRMEQLEFQDQLLGAVREIISGFCHDQGLPKKAGTELFKNLQKEAMENKDELLDEVPAAAMRIWTSSQTTNDIDTEFCSILNSFIRNDHEGQMQNVVKYCRSLNSLLVNRRSDKAWNEKKWPDDNKLYRGGGFPDHHKSFFQEGKMFRVPMFLATSEDKKVSTRFCEMAYDKGFSPVRWTLHLDKEHKCKHVCYVDRTNVPGESEFLFVPYSCFTVKSVRWQEDPNYITPHEIELEVAVDNRFHDKKVLPLAPWS